MGRSSKVRKPNAAESRQLGLWVEEAEHAWQRRRAAIVMYYAMGQTAQDIAAALAIHPNTVYAILHAFDRRGLAAVRQPLVPGARVRIQPTQVAQMCRVADASPGDFGLPYGRWSLTTLRRYLLAERIVRRISREHLRRLLKKGASTYAATDAS